MPHEDRNRRNNRRALVPRGRGDAQEDEPQSHSEPSDPICRFLNAGIAGTYVRPHRHRIGKWELVSVIQGKFDLVIFTSDGVVKSRVALSSEGATVAEIPGGE